jgi:WD40 repeat protein
MVAATWSPDGASVAGLMVKDGLMLPAVVGVGADMSPHIVPRGPSCLGPPEWSPSGNWIACESKDGVALFTPDGSNTKMLPRIHSAALAFSRDGKTIYAVGRERGHSFLKSIQVETGSVRTIADYGPGVIFDGGSTYSTRLSLSPDGASLATSAVSNKSDIWMLEGYPLPRPWWKLWH